MSDKVVVMTKDLIDLLSILKITCEQKGKVPEINGVYIYSTRGAYGDEPGEQDLLAGISTDYSTAGHTYIQIEGGDLGDEGVFIPLDELKAIEMRMKSIQEEEHVMTISVDTVDEIVTFEEYDKDNPFIHRFPLVDVDFPVSAVQAWLEGSSNPLQDEMGVPLDDGDVMVLNTDAMSTISKVAKKLKESGIPTVKKHRAAVYPLELGEFWRGAMLPDELVISNDKDDLVNDMYLP